MSRTPQATLLTLLRYDADTGKLFWRERPRSMFTRDQVWRWWNNRFSGQEALTSIDTRGYKHGMILNRLHLAHRVIATMYFGDLSRTTEHVDHIDGDKLNNRLVNLRVVSRQDNNKNARLRSDNTSGRVGVQKRKERWRANIGVDGRNVGLGSFRTFEEAVAARVAAEQAHGFHTNHGRA